MAWWLQAIGHYLIQRCATSIHHMASPGHNEFFIQGFSILQNSVFVRLDILIFDSSAVVPPNKYQRDIQWVSIRWFRKYMENKRAGKPQHLGHNMFRLHNVALPKAVVILEWLIYPTVECLDNPVACTRLRWLFNIIDMIYVSIEKVAARSHCYLFVWVSRLTFIWHGSHYQFNKIVHFY